MVIDSTILVDAVRGQAPAKKFLEAAGEKLFISRAGVMEMVRGSRNKRDFKAVSKLIAGLNIEIVEISDEISAAAGAIFESYWHSHGVGAMDSFIAATALMLKQRLATHNIKHFKPIKGLNLTVPY